MTEQYTPTTDEVRDSYRFSHQRPDICGKDFGLEFDRWLAEVEREAAEKALARVRELHRRQPDTISGLDTGPAYCRCGEHYPCPTIMALEGDK